MPRTALTKTTAPGSYFTAGVVITMGAADAANGNSFVMGGNDLLLVHNSHASLAKTVTITSVPDEQKRSKNITAESLAAGVTKCYGPFKDLVGWAQSTGVLHVDGEDNNILFGVIAMPQE